MHAYRRSWVFIFCLCGVCSLQSAEARDKTQYFAVMLDGKRIGHAIHSRIVEGEKVKTEESLTYTVERLGVKLQVHRREHFVETRDGRPLGFELIIDSSSREIRMLGQVYPDGAFKTKIQSRGQSLEHVGQWPAGALLPEGQRLFLQKQSLRLDAKMVLTSFEPLILDTVPLHVRVGQERRMEIQGHRRYLTELQYYYGALSDDKPHRSWWVDKEGLPSQMVLPYHQRSMTLVAVAKRQALAPVESYELEGDMVLACPVPLEELTEAEAVAYVMRSKNRQERLAWMIPRSNDQAVQPLDIERILVKVQPWHPQKRVVFPYKGNDPTLRRSLQATAYMQVDHPQVIKHARKATASAVDGADAARKIEAYVADYIQRKDLSVGFASAVEVLETRRGDCTEHAVLMAALCRAAGLPARVAVGLAYVDRFGDRRHVLVGHAWTHVFLDGRWVGFDAALRESKQGGYGPGHILLGLGDGEPGDFAGLPDVVGQFEIESVSVTR